MNTYLVTATFKNVALMGAAYDLFLKVIEAGTLNDDFEGGQTIFPQYDYQSEVTTGSVLIFPVAWNYLHRGKPITNGYAKYMLGSFLQYEQRQEMNRIGDKTMGLDNTNI